MPILPTALLPKNILEVRRRPGNLIRASQILPEVAQSSPEAVLSRLQTSENGLSEEEAERRLEEYGPNVVAQEQRLGLIRLFTHACMNPLVILLLLLAAVSFLVGNDYRAGTVMVIMVVLGVWLRFVRGGR